MGSQNVFHLNNFCSAQHYVSELMIALVKIHHKLC